MIMLTFNQANGRTKHGPRLVRAIALSACLLVTTSALSALPSPSQASPTSNSSGTNSFDPMRDGWDSNEPHLKPTDVSSSSFGQIFQTQLQGQVYAQPIVANNHLIVATEDNVIYGLDPATGNKTWTRDLSKDDTLNTGLPAQYPWPAGSQTVSCGDLLPNIGITSTPVYNPTTNSVYFVNKWDNGADHSNAHYFIHAIDPATGVERPNFPHEISGRPSNDSTIQFDAFTQLQRPGLLLLDGAIYIGFGSHCDYAAGGSRPYRGFIVGVDASSGSQTAMWTTETSVASAGGAGVWQAGTGLMSDGPGRIFFSTGNGVAPPVPTGASSLLGSAASTVRTFSESIVRLQVQPDGSLAAADFFSPSNADVLDLQDLDISSGGPVALPDSFSTSPHLLTVQGKDGRLFLLNRDSLGGRVAATGTDRALGVTATGDAQYGRQAVWGGDGGYVYNSSYDRGLRAYVYGLTTSGQPSLTDVGGSQTRYFGFGSGSPIVTSDGTASNSATVWVITEAGSDGSNGTLHAFNAVPSTGIMDEIYTAPIGFATKFSTPMAYNGRIYVGTRCSPNSTTSASAPCHDGMIQAFGSPTTNLLTGNALDLGSTPTGQTLSGTITLTASAAAKVTITNASTSSPFSVATSANWTPAPTAPGSSVVVAAGQSIQIPVSFTATAPGAFSGLLSVQTDVGKFDFGLHASATTRELLVTSPKLNSNAVLFPVQPTGITRTINVQVSNMGPTPETITDISGISAPFSIRGSLTLPINLAPAGQPGSAVVIPVSFRPTTAPSDGSAAPFTGEIDVTGTASLSTSPLCVNSSPCIPLKGTAVIAAPHVTYTPVTNAFGIVPVGKAATHTFQITNDGNLPITIVKAKPPVSVFTATRPVDEGTTIPVGESVAVDVRFAPSTAGVSSDHYSITPSAGSSMTTISFTGIGVDIPTAPRAISVTPGVRSVVATWSQALSNGGLNLTGYTVTATPGGRSCSTGPSVLRCTVTGLTDGIRYRLQVRARNALGSSITPASSVSFVAGAPSPPRNLAVVANGAGASRVTWLAPALSGSAPVTRYLVRVSADGGSTWTMWTGRTMGPGLRAQLSGLSKGHRYELQLHAVNKFGDGLNASMTFVQRT